MASFDRIELPNQTLAINSFMADPISKLLLKGAEC